MFIWWSLSSFKFMFLYFCLYLCLYLHLYLCLDLVFVLFLFKPLLLRMCSGCSSGATCPRWQKEMGAFSGHSSCDSWQTAIESRSLSLHRQHFQPVLIFPYLGIHHGDFNPEVWTLLALQKTFPSTYHGTKIITTWMRRIWGRWG